MKNILVFSLLFLTAGCYVYPAQPVSVYQPAYVVTPTPVYGSYGGGVYYRQRFYR